MIQIFLGYRPLVGHLIKVPPIGEPIIQDFTDEVAEWCAHNLKGEAWPIYHRYEHPDEHGVMRGWARWEFLFDYEEDIVLFKLFHIG